MKTVGQMLAEGYEVAVYCGNFRCDRNKRRGEARHCSEVDLEALDPSLRVDSIKDRLRCTVCGERQASIRLSVGANSLSITGHSAFSPEVRATALRLIAERRAEKRARGAYAPARPAPWKKPR